MRGAGLRLTPQRRAVVAALAGSKIHPDVEQVAAAAAAHAPGLSLSTVYKIVHELRDLGLVREMQVGGTTRIDPDLDHHLHIVCDECGAIADTHIPKDVSRSLACAAAHAGATAVSFEIVIRGRCSRCGGACRP